MNNKFICIVALNTEILALKKLLLTLDRSQPGTKYLIIRSPDDLVDQVLDAKAYFIFKFDVTYFSWLQEKTIVNKGIVVNYLDSFLNTIEKKQIPDSVINISNLEYSKALTSLISLKFEINSWGATKIGLTKSCLTPKNLMPFTLEESQIYNSPLSLILSTLYSVNLIDEKTSSLEISSILNSYRSFDMKTSDKKNDLRNVSLFIGERDLNNQFLEGSLSEEYPLNISHLPFDKDYDINLETSMKELANIDLVITDSSTLVSLLSFYSIPVIFIAMNRMELTRTYFKYEDFIFPYFLLDSPRDNMTKVLNKIFQFLTGRPSEESNMLMVGKFFNLPVFFNNSHRTLDFCFRDFLHKSSLVLNSLSSQVLKQATPDQILNKHKFKGIISRNIVNEEKTHVVNIISCLLGIIRVARAYKTDPNFYIDKFYKGLERLEALSSVNLSSSLFVKSFLEQAIMKKGLANNLEEGQKYLESNIFELKNKLQYFNLYLNKLSDEGQESIPSSFHKSEKSI